MQNLKKMIQRTYLQDRNRVTDVENKRGSQGRKEGRINWETGIDICIRLDVKCVAIDNKNLLCSRTYYIYRELDLLVSNE